MTDEIEHPEGDEPPAGEEQSEFDAPPPEEHRHEHGPGHEHAPSWEEPDAASWEDAEPEYWPVPSEERQRDRRSPQRPARPGDRSGRAGGRRRAAKDRARRDGRDGRPTRGRGAPGAARTGSGVPPLQLGSSATGAAAHPHHPAHRRASARRIWVRRGVAIAAILFTIFAAWFLIELFQPFHGSGHGSIEVTVPKGASTSQVGSILARDGVISSSFFFKLRADLDGSTKITAGKHKMELGMSYAAALKALAKPPLPPPTASITIAPGRSRQQLRKLLKSQGIKGNYVKETKHSKLLDPTTYGAAKSTPNLEGFLFPDTYQIRKPVTMSVLVADQLKQFKQQFKQVNLTYAHSKNLTAYDVVIIGSLLEGEAKTRKDARLVASVIYNRLRLGMDLGLDSTVRYATGNYGTLTQSDLNSSSPWNTRNHAGLPPTPINSPGLQAMKDAAHPAQSSYLYFVNKVCGNGKLLFTASYSQFLVWSQAWNDAVAKAQQNNTSAEYCKKQKS